MLSGGPIVRSASLPPTLPLSNPKSPWRCRARPRAKRPSAPWAKAATTCTIAATTLPTWPRTASLKKWRTCYPRQAAHRRRAGRIQKRCLHPAQFARRSEAGARNSRPHAPHGRAAHRRLRPRLCTAGGPDHNDAGARSIADTLLASQPSMLLYWHHYAATAAASRWTPTASRSPRIFSICCTAGRPAWSGFAAMQTSLILYAEHEFNASTFTARVIAGTGSDHLLLHCRRHRRAQGTQAWRRQRSGARHSAALRLRPTRPTPTSAAASPTARSSSASAIRSTPSAIRAATSSRNRRAGSPSTTGDGASSHRRAH
jgi:hypothetical protein